ncbi:uncharacterized protein LOC129194253 isoform X2 [Dunckerocampus dactyliophorus]|nr:uncharacterized protein LOC129194253 isoform X2 [Dunckerocampus dactyliophorus]
MLAKHINANHRQNGNQRKEEVRSIARKSSDPQMKPRLTRSAVKDMCWLRQDCLALPGRDFLDKYCHLSDPQTTLEETQQFLMKSVAGEKGDEKWTKALKSVLSNVPQDISIHSKSENGMSNSADLTVLTVQNKITVAQKGDPYAKRLKMMEETEKECHFPESTAADVGQNGGQVILNDDPHGLQVETKQSEDTFILTHNDPPKCVQILENLENQELKADLHKGVHKDKQPHLEGIGMSDELMVINESQEEKSTVKERPKNKRRTQRRKRKSRSKKAVKGTSGLALKIVLKKNPVKERQWVSQSPSDMSSMEDQHAKPNSDLTVQDATQGTDQHDPTEAITLAHAPSGTGLPPLCAAKAAVVEDSFLPHVGKWDDAKKSLHFSETDLDESRPSNSTGSSVEVFPDSMQLPPAGGVPDCCVSADDGATRSCCSKSPPPSQPAITQQGMINSGDVRLVASTEQSDHVREVPPESCPNLLSNADPPMEKAIQQEPWTAYVRSRPVPKSLERTLKLIAISPSQLIRRPVRDQPVVVLNHPDADIPEVAKIMEVVNRYKGEVQKVILSRTTLNALSATTAVTNDPANTQTRPPCHGENLIQERFILKLRLRRLGRKKYEVLDPVSPSRDVAKKFSCWFCGRVFEKQEVWMVHRQRHLMDWRRPNCENV